MNNEYTVYAVGLIVILIIRKSVLHQYMVCDVSCYVNRRRITYYVYAAAAALCKY